MSAPIDLVLTRLPDARPTGIERWRCACPAHGGTNKSTLSIGVGDNGAVLLRCWSGCSIEQITSALGLAVEDLFPPKEVHAGPLKRRRMLTAQQALDLLESEALIVYVVATDVRRRRSVSEADFERLQVAAARIQKLGREVMA